MSRSTAPRSPQLPLTIRRRAAAPLQQQIYEQLRYLVDEGILRPGDRVPSTRGLSEQLGVSRNTVTIAFELLIAEGYLESTTSAGTAVSITLPAAALHATVRKRSAKAQGVADRPRQAIQFRGQRPRLYDPAAHALLHDFRLGQADQRLFPAKLWKRLVLESLDSAGTGLVRYGDPCGFFPLRRAIADHLRLARGMVCEPEQIMIVAGCQEGINVAARVLLSDGDEVVLENPCYEGAALVFESYGAGLLPTEVDDEGMRIDGLPASPALAYVTPSHQFPLGPTMSHSRRIELLEWATRTGAYVLEDDYDSDFRYEGSPLAALSALDANQRVIYLGTFSKSIGPGLRLGYVVFPAPLMEAAATVKSLMNHGQPWLDQAVLAEFVDSGGFEQHLRRIRQHYRARRDCLLHEIDRHFGKCRVDGVEGGMHVAWYLPEGTLTASRMYVESRRAKVGVYTLREGPVHCHAQREVNDGVVLLGYPSLSESRIKAGVELIAQATLS